MWMVTYTALAKCKYTALAKRKPTAPIHEIVYSMNFVKKAATCIVYHSKQAPNLSTPVNSLLYTCA